MSSVQITDSGKQKTDHDSFDVNDGTQIVITQAFGPDGDSLVGVSDVTFDGHPAISLLIKADGREGLVHLSPIHGDVRKEGFTDIPEGARCELYCPTSKAPLPKIEVSEGEDEAGYYGIFLTRNLQKGSMVIVCDIWGHHDSRLIDEFELISRWAKRGVEAEAE